jgi:hypothetical protein
MGFTATANAACPDSIRLTGICNSIATEKKDRDPEGPYLYVYQRQIHEAACANPDVDSDAVVQAKIAALWKSNQPALRCRQQDLNVVDGNILKLAVTRHFIDVLEDAAQLWRVDLNVVDPSDGRTVLDYTRDEIGRNNGNASEPVLRTYYDMLRKSGARHRSEL